MPDDPSKELRDGIQRLEHRLRELQTERDEMDLALRAAANGDLTPAEIYAAAGVFGLRDLNPGNCVLAIVIRNVQPSSTGAVGGVLASHTIASLRSNTYGVIVSRLWIEKQEAPHFHLKGAFRNGSVNLLDCRTHETSIPCELFAKDFWSPRFDWHFALGDVLSLHVLNMSQRPRHFRMLALGHYAV